MKKLFAGFWTLLILALCSIPGESIPDVDIVSADKLAHFTLFAVFAWMWLLALDIRLRRAVIYVTIGGVFFAVGTEFYQGILPFDRQPSALDAIANLAGLASGVWLFGRIGPRRPAGSSIPVHSSRQ